MKDKELISKIKTLKKIEPNENWLVSTREKLDFEIDEKPAVLVNFFKFSKLAGFFVSLLIIIVGPLVAIKAAEDSVPGDMLYAVKRLTEGAQVKIPGADRVNLQTEFAGRRLEELHKVNLNKLLSKNEKSKNTQEAIEGLKNNLAQLNSQIEEDVSQGKKDEIAEFTKESKQIEEKLDKVEQQASSESVQTEIAEVKKMFDQIKDFALASLYKEETGSSTPKILDKTTTTTDEIKDKGEVETLNSEDDKESTEKNSTSTSDKKTGAEDENKED